MTVINVPRGSIVDGLAVLGRRYPLCRGHGWLARNLFPDPGGNGEAVEVTLRDDPPVRLQAGETVNIPATAARVPQRRRRPRPTARLVVRRGSRF